MISRGLRWVAVKRFLPSAADYSGLSRSWPRDLMAGLTVGVVALPLALAFGVATGVGAGPGIVTAIIAGTVAAVFGGSRLQVSGPTGAMTVVLVPLVAQHGPAVVYPVALLAGIVVLLSALLRLGRLLDHIPWPLIEGFTVGIAVVIAAQEIPSALGVVKPEIDNAAAAAAISILRFVEHPHWPVLGLLILSVGATVLLTRVHRAVPAGLIAVVGVTVVAGVGGMDVARIGTIPAGLPVPSLPSLAGAGSLIGPVLVVAFLAGLESLMSARVADGMSDAPRHDPDRELFGQGLANIAAGFCGGMPATGAIARTAVNARAGAHTRVAALTHAIVLAIIMFAAAPLVGKIPLVALAGVLLVTAYRMVEKRSIRSVLTSTRGDAAVFAVTAVCTVAFDLITAVAIGLVLAGALALRRLASTSQAVVQVLRPDDLSSAAEHELLASHVLVYRLDGPLFFPVVGRFLAEMTAIADVRVVILRLGSLAMLDASGAKALGDVVQQLAERDIIVLFKGATAENERLLAAVGTLQPLVAKGHVFDDLGAAIAHAARHVRRVSA
ncbi:SulP family sulfate permease [Nakamurella sp. UYEF19]|uniref:SulP family inorganic anion transporter n=1 Tax=Nakamurella sp. UYEF19 TaxID=1756392 RepID=UPI0033962251